MKNGIIIRKAEKEDVRQIAEICVEDWQKAYRGIVDSDFLDSLSVEQRYELEIRRYDKFIVAADADRILGYAWLESTEDEPADCEIIALYVRYSERKNGIGKLLFQDAVNALIEADPSIRPGLLQYMIEIVIADKDIHEKEVNFIYDIGQKLGLDLKEISRIFASMVQRYFSPSLSSLA